MPRDPYPPPLCWTPELVERYWDYQSNRPGHYFTEVLGKTLARKFARHAGPGSRVLDYGCGAGHFIRHLLEGGATVFGLEHSRCSAALAVETLQGRERFGGIIDPENLEPHRGLFDAVFIIEVIEHLDDAALDRLAAAALLLLKPSGTLILTTPNGEDLSREEIYCPSCHRTFHRWQHVRSWNPATLRAYLESRGFAVEYTQGTDLRARWSHSAGRFVKRLGRRLRGKKTRNPHLLCEARPAGSKPN